VFVLAPEATVTLDGPRAVVTVGGTRATFEASGISGWRAAPGEYSARFGARCATTRLAGSPVGAAVRTTIHLDGR
jgi:hypothetical protein